MVLPSYVAVTATADEMSLAAGTDGSIQTHQQEIKMESKSELAAIVPTMAQEKALDWLLQKLDEDIATASTYKESAESQDMIQQAAVNRAKLISDSLLIMYSPRVFKVDANALISQLDKSDYPQNTRW